MTEIYWLTRLSALNTFFIALIVVFGAMVFFSGCFKFFSIMDGLEMKLPGKILKWSIPSLIIVSLLAILTPTTKEALVIYGVGGTIEFVKNDSTMQRLPHKVVEACEAYVESLVEDGLKPKE